MLRKTILIISLTLTACATNYTDRINSVSSPDEKIRVNFFLDEGAPTYNVIFEGDTLFKNSSLGIQFKNFEPMNSNFEIIDVEENNFNESWEPVWGTDSVIFNNYNEAKFYLKKNNPSGNEMILTFRVFNDGLGFRYKFPEGGDSVFITSEDTYFNFANDMQAWWIPDDYDSYEHLYKNTKMSELEGVNTPATFESGDSLFVSLHEAALFDYAGMTLVRDKNNLLALKSELVPWADGIKVKTKTPFKTPWRTIQISKTPGGLVESHILQNLNEPSKITDASWIKPMKYIGIWWGMHIDKNTWMQGERHGATTDEAKRYIDFASENNISGVLIEGWNEGWETWLTEGAEFNFLKAYDDFDIVEVTDYAKEKGVVIIGHHETGGNVPVYERQLDSALALYNELGIPAIKTGYAGKIYPEGEHHHGQKMVNHYNEVVRKAADHKIMIDAHEPIKPTGESRTYPNMMTREGVRGTEYQAWGGGNPPEHLTVLPFTRMLAGPIDYTPGIFDLRFEEYKPNDKVLSTLANQFALYVVIYSPMQMAADLPENYLDKMNAFQFIKDVPVDWDESKVLQAKIGDYVSIARRAGDNWYIGSVTDENARELQINLDFLEEGKTYLAVIYEDGEGADYETNPQPYKIREVEVMKGDVIKANLARGGGQAVEIKFI